MKKHNAAAPATGASATGSDTGSTAGSGAAAMQTISINQSINPSREYSPSRKRSFGTVRTLNDWLWLRHNGCGDGNESTEPANKRQKTDE